MVVLDSSMLMLFLRPGAGVPTDASGQPVTDPKGRVEFLIEKLEDTRTKIAIPTPALSEVLIRAGAAASQHIVETLNKQVTFSIAPFDQRAAIEVAAMLRDELKEGKKALKGDAVWAKVKYDRQIVAIAKVIGATTIYSDDRDIRAIAARANIPIVRVCDLPLSPKSLQGEFGLYKEPDA